MMLNFGQLSKSNFHSSTSPESSLVKKNKPVLRKLHFQSYFIIITYHAIASVRKCYLPSFPHSQMRQLICWAISNHLYTGGMYSIIFQSWSFLVHIVYFFVGNISVLIYQKQVGYWVSSKKMTWKVRNLDRSVKGRFPPSHTHFLNPSIYTMIWWKYVMNSKVKFSNY